MKLVVEVRLAVGAVIIVRIARLVIVSLLLLLAVLLYLVLWVLWFLVSQVSIGLVVIRIFLRSGEGRERSLDSEYS